MGKINQLWIALFIALCCGGICLEISRITKALETTNDTLDAITFCLLTMDEDLKYHDVRVRFKDKEIP